MSQTWNTGPCSCTGFEPRGPDWNGPAREALGVPKCTSSSSEVMEAALPAKDRGGVLNSLPVGLEVSRNFSPPMVGMASKSDDESVSPVPHTVFHTWTVLTDNSTPRPQGPLVHEK